MGEQYATKQPVKVFISYSWDDHSHQDWVRDFATRLRKDGINVTLDRWHAVPGDQLPEFMEKAVRESDFVLCICTPEYKYKSDQRGGGVGYEGDVITGDIFANRNQRKFIPIFRMGEWKEAAPSWLFGKYYIDLTGEPYSEQNYQDLLTTLRNEREMPPPIGNGFEKSNGSGKPAFEFVNREIELATLDPAKLDGSYWQCALISAPTGYGKSRLVYRLLDKIREDPVHNDNWNCRYIDLSNCGYPGHMIMHVVREITGEPVTIDQDKQELKNKLCSYVLDKMSIPSTNGSLRNILLVVDSVDHLPPAVINWFASVIHDLVIGSYVDYEDSNVSFHVRVIISGVDTESVWQNYLNWEASGAEKYRLKPPKRLPLSAFDELAVQEMINRRAKREGITLSVTTISEISFELQYLSGGHPQVVAEILDELAAKNFRMYREHLQNNRQRLISTYVSMVAMNVLRRFTDFEIQRDIKTVCLFRLINLNTLEKLRVEKLVSTQVDITLLGRLCESKILNPPNADKLFYHDDIIRRILYLDLAYGDGRDDDHVQRTHKCARLLYGEWIKNSNHSLHYFFVEWLYHSMQVSTLLNKTIISEWKSLLSLVRTTTLPLADLKHAINEKIKKDYEVRYLFRERFGSDEFSKLFDE